MIYLPVATDDAPALSRMFQKLIRPDTVNSDDVTLYYCGWEKHPTREDVVCLVLPDDGELPVTPNSEELDKTALQMADLFKKSDELGKLNQKEIDDQDVKLKTKEGKRVLIADLLPPTWNEAAMDKAKAEKDGWIAKQDDKLNPEKDPVDGDEKEKTKAG